MSIVDRVFNVPVGTGTSLAGVGSPFFDIALPRIVQIAGAIYLFLLLVHQGWKMYRDWKKKDAPEE